MVCKGRGDNLGGSGKGEEEGKQKILDSFEMDICLFCKVSIGCTDSTKFIHAD